MVVTFYMEYQSATKNKINMLILGAFVLGEYSLITQAFT